MTEFLLLVIAVLVWVLLKRKRDWYVVEWRFCSDGKLASSLLSAPRHAVDKLTIEVYELTPIMQRVSGVRYGNKSGGELQIEQMVFEDLDAARLHFRYLKSLLGTNREMRYQKLYLYRVVAPSRAKALSISPKTGRHKLNELFLVEYPRHFYTDFDAEESRSTTDS